MESNRKFSLAKPYSLKAVVFEHLSDDQRQQLLADGYEAMKLAGAHYVIDTIAMLPQALEVIQQWCVEGERP